MATAAAAVSRSVVLCRPNIRELTSLRRFSCRIPDVSPLLRRHRAAASLHTLEGGEAAAAPPLRRRRRRCPPPQRGGHPQGEGPPGFGHRRGPPPVGLRRRRVGVYCGFDPTAESLHLGNLLGIIVLSWFRRCGHRVFALIGGATARVGDPSGKSLERPELDAAAVERNSAAIREIISRILGESSSPSPSSSGPFAIVDNYDWWKEMKLLDFLREVGRFARVGRWWPRRASEERERRRLAGRRHAAPYQFYQYFFSVPDADVVRFLKMLTFLSMAEIREVEEGMKLPSYDPNSAQRKLAEEVTRFVHGEEGLGEARRATAALRPGRRRSWIPPGPQDAPAGGLYLNNQRVDSEDKVVQPGDVVDGKLLLLSAGKKNKIVIRVLAS
ncbi:unnamed protein product [Spirodela intermedia]|uniref:tyrosine--tRNA ligase n=1 Tax=Spirodela intermedia TaxID=51605 RepID=A0A7I8IQL3_SPIIN|nr:unnamed protein product [Spirodela intermedia]CAA6659300.1 unnamed protein product [Spirodela intermedia]